MSAVSNRVMPRSSALCTALRVASNPVRPPKLLHPRPTTEPCRPELPSERRIIADLVNRCRNPSSMTVRLESRGDWRVLGGREICRQGQAGGEPQREKTDQSGAPEGRQRSFICCRIERKPFASRQHRLHEIVPSEKPVDCDSGDMDCNEPDQKIGDQNM